MSESIVFGAIRTVRFFIGLFFGTAVIGLLAGIPGLLRLYENPGYAGTFLLKILAVVASFAVFEFLRRVVNSMHRASFGKPHPSLKRIFSI